MAFRLPKVLWHDLIRSVTSLQGTMVESKMRSTLGRLVGRGALLAALGFGGFGAMYGASAHSDDVLQLADFSWGSVVPDGETEGDKPVADDGVIEVDPIRISEDFSWG